MYKKECWKYMIWYEEKKKKGIRFCEYFYVLWHVLKNVLINCYKITFHVLRSKKDIEDN